MPPSPRLPDGVLIRPPDPGVGAAPSLIMTGAIELRGVDAGRASQPVERVVPCQRVRAFMAEHLDGLWLTQVPVEIDHEPLFPPKALAQDRFGQPGGPNDDEEGWRASPPKSRQSGLEGRVVTYAFFRSSDSKCRE